MSEHFCLTLQTEKSVIKINTCIVLVFYFEIPPADSIWQRQKLMKFKLKIIVGSVVIYDLAKILN